MNTDIPIPSTPTAIIGIVLALILWAVKLIHDRRRDRKEAAAEETLRNEAALDAALAGEDPEDIAAAAQRRADHRTAAH